MGAHLEGVIAAFVQVIQGGGSLHAGGGIISVFSRELLRHNEPSFTRGVQPLTWSFAVPEERCPAVSSPAARCCAVRRL